MAHTGLSGGWDGRGQWEEIRFNAETAVDQPCPVDDAPWADGGTAMYTGGGAAWYSDQSTPLGVTLEETTAPVCRYCGGTFGADDVRCRGCGANVTEALQ